MPSPQTMISPSIILTTLLLAYSYCLTSCLQCTTVRPGVFSNTRKSNILISAPKNLPRKHITICQMNKVPNYFDLKGEPNNDSNGETTKRSILRRVKDRISRTFGDKSNDTSSNKNNTSNEKESNENKPNIFDAARLKLALAMSNINFNVFGSRDEWVVACPKTRVGPGVITPCVVNGLDIIIFASRDGKRLDAFANSCPHLGSPFDLATIEQKPALGGGGGGDEDGSGGCVDCIVCPVHRTAFEIESGNVRGEWCPYPPILGGVMGYVKPKSSLVKFAVRLRGKNVEVRVATSMKNVNNRDEKADGMKDIN